MMKKIAKLNDVAFHLINKVNKKKLKSTFRSYFERVLTFLKRSCVDLYRAKAELRRLLALKPQSSTVDDTLALLMSMKSLPRQRKTMQLSLHE